MVPRRTVNRACCFRKREPDSVTPDSAPPNIRLPLHSPNYDRPHPALASAKSHAGTPDHVGDLRCSDRRNATLDENGSSPLALVLAPDTVLHEPWRHTERIETVYRGATDAMGYLRTTRSSTNAVESVALRIA